MQKNILDHSQGKKMDIEDPVELDNEIAAQNFFLEAKRRLLNINNWHKIAEVRSSTFEHLDIFGNPIFVLPEEGDYIKIDIPEPGLNSTGGYDYAQIKQISETSSAEDELLSITVRPSSDPNSEHDDGTKHFFKNMVSQTFPANRERKIVKAHYYGRNEVINLEVDSFVDRLRNLFVGLSAKLGASYP
ncbi:hypothetical protein [Sphingobacterium sp. BN32]|uniref:hypothetical protein n=1 Tax=Sphingobacterium sp. BN32 TaxID=3058432 RepID=UPI00265CD120|nr:hypothetical protein [Sphingobacterium sp. BN32]WKK58352.1 hypothetical protein QYC40_17115 [Sphingobacterium sp. BN32]